MAGYGGNDTVQQVLESSQQPSPQASNLRKQWTKKQPHEQVAASRRLLYGVIEPCLTNGEPLDQDAIQQIEAVFETTFTQFEQFSMGRSARASSPSSS